MIKVYHNLTLKHFVHTGICNVQMLMSL
jgi:hypothetical protein